MAAPATEPRIIPLREPKSPPERAHTDRCPGRQGRIEERGAQDTVRCTVCDAYLYNAPRVETGREVRSVSTVHNGIKPKQRSRVIERATGRCELCGARGDLHVGHLLSVKAGLEQGLTETELNDDSNLAAMCEECNLGIGKNPVPLRLVIALVMARTRNQGAPTE